MLVTFENVVASHLLAELVKVIFNLGLLSHYLDVFYDNSYSLLCADMSIDVLF